MTLGDLIRAARKTKSLTAREATSAAGLDISPATFSQWESGSRVPTPVDLEALCRVLSIPPRLAFTYWAQAHMPSKHLKALFDPGEQFSGTKLQASTEKRVSDPTAFPASITLTLQGRDAAWFCRHPEAMTLLTRALMAGLAEQAWPASRLAGRIGLTQQKAKTILERLVKLRYLIKEGQSYRTPHGVKYVYRPDTPEFAPLKNARIEYITRRLLTNITPAVEAGRRGIKQMYGARLEHAQIEYFCSAIEAVFNELVDTHAKDKQKAVPYYLVATFGPEEPDGE